MNILIRVLALIIPDFLKDKAGVPSVPKIVIFTLSIIEGIAIGYILLYLRII
jgi:hypothetical protein